MTVTRKRVVFFERWFDPVAEHILGAEHDIELVRLSFSALENENWRMLAGAQGYQISARTELREPWFGTAELLRHMPDLLAVSSTGAGYDVIDVDACTSAGVLVVNQSGTNSEPVAEHAMALMLGLTKRVRQSNLALLRNTAADRLQLFGHNIKGKTVGIVGIGEIGRLTAKYCAAFDMRVLAYDPHLSAAEVSDRGAERVDFETLLREADFVTVHCPRSAETLGMFGAEAFSQMKPGAYFINTARGRIHDETALLHALRTGQIAGAGLDVFDTEPPAPDHPLLHLDNVIATPHIAGGTREAMRDMSAAAAEQWIALLRGRVPPRLVNPEVWPLYAERFARIVGYRPDEIGLPVAKVA